MADPNQTLSVNEVCQVHRDGVIPFILPPSRLQRLHNIPNPHWPIDHGHDGIALRHPHDLFVTHATIVVGGKGLAQGSLLGLEPFDPRRQCGVLSLSFRQLGFHLRQLRSQSVVCHNFSLYLKEILNKVIKENQAPAPT
jgi:hypothetical protein